MMWDVWWIWMVAAVALGTLEVLIPAFVFLGFAIGAVATGLLLLVAAPWISGMSASVAVILLFFAIASLISWIVVRKLVGVREGQVKHWHTDIND
jgi:membrane protein implicated in regulation of membrane protease activity